MLAVAGVVEVIQQLRLVVLEAVALVAQFLAMVLMEPQIQAVAVAVAAVLIAVVIRRVLATVALVSSLSATCINKV
jgi:hypothetical protein